MEVFLKKKTKQTNFTRLPKAAKEKKINPTPISGGEMVVFEEKTSPNGEGKKKKKKKKPSPIWE